MLQLVGWPMDDRQVCCRNNHADVWSRKEKTMAAGLVRSRCRRGLPVRLRAVGWHAWDACLVTFMEKGLHLA